jgi:UDP-3-O-[3-hydroxymyristoyl] glucosamine N-acyltransferase
MRPQAAPILFRQTAGLPGFPAKEASTIEEKPMTQYRKSLTAEEIAASIGGRIEGDPSQAVCGVETVDKAESDMLTWIGSRKYASKLTASRAGIVLMPNDGEAPADRTAIRVEDPDLALCEVLKLFAPPQDLVEPGVHPSAVIGVGAIVEGSSIGPNVVVGDAAVIGPGSTLYPGVFVGTGTEIGRDCVLWPNVVIREHVKIGDRVIIHPNSTVGADGFSYLQRRGRHIRVPQVGTVVIEDDVEIGANATIDRARSGATTIRRGTKIDNLVIVAHNCDIGEGSLLAAMSGVAGSTRLGKYVVCGGNVGIIDHLDIGDGVQIGASSTAFNDIPAGSLVRGNPARPLTRFGREQAALKRLPELLKTVKDLQERVQQLQMARPVDEE